MQPETLEAFSRGFDAGNYGNAYEGEELSAVYNEDEGEEEYSDKERQAFRAGFVLGFFSSYEDDEIPSDEFDEFETARREWGPVAEANGIAI